MLRDSGHPVVASLLDVAMYSFRRTRAKLIPKARGEVLEIGLGTGANLEFYGDISSLTAVEPDPHMRARALPRAAAAPFPVEILSVGAESLPHRDHSFDTVVATWVLCTIPDPRAAVQEMRRVLRPSGRLLFAEHTVSPSAAPAAMQRLLNPCWCRLAGGCHLNRDSLGLLREHFRDLTVDTRSPQRWSIAPSFHGTALAPLSSA